MQFRVPLIRIIPAVWCALSVYAQPAPDLEAQEQFLLNAKIVNVKYADKGITNSRRATLSDGVITHDAHVQSIDEAKASFQTDRGTELNFRDSYKFNIAGYRLARLLGLEHMVPPSVERKVAGKTSAVTWWVDEVLMDEAARLNKKLNTPDPDRWNKQMHIVRVFDQLIFNVDRNMGNLLICKDWSLKMIDHTRAFRIRRDLQNHKNLVMVDRVLLDRMRALNRDQLTEALGAFLRKNEIEALLSRRDAIVAHFEAKIRANGEKTVLYSYLGEGSSVR